MLRLTFLGGIHPDDGKAMSKDRPIREVLPKGELVYPLSQHIGAPVSYTHLTLPTILRV